MLSVENIEHLLSAINERLRKQNIAGTIVLAGGAVMALVMRSREATFDIDALFEPADKIRAIAKQIAIEEGLEEDWINDGVKGFVDTSRMGTVPVRQYSNLDVRRFDDESLLALKLSAARQNNDKDFNDSLCLMGKVGVRDMDHVYEILERHIPRQLLTPRIDYFAQAVFSEYMSRQNAACK